MNYIALLSIFSVLLCTMLSSEANKKKVESSIQEHSEKIDVPVTAEPPSTKATHYAYRVFFQQVSVPTYADDTADYGALYMKDLSPTAPVYVQQNHGAPSDAD